MNAKQYMIEERNKYISRFMTHLLSFDVAAIGFAIYTTIEQPPIYSHLIILTAVICWSISTYHGMRFWKDNSSNAYDKIIHFDLLTALVKKRRLNPESLSEAEKELLKLSDNADENVGKRLTSSWKLFLAGIFFYILGHISLMYELNRPSNQSRNMKITEEILSQDIEDNDLIEQRYIDKYPTQSQEIIGYIQNIQDPDAFRADLQKALDSNKVIEFEYDTILLDAAPTYQLVDAPSSQE